MINKEYFNIICGESLEVLKTLPDCSVQCCVTSPPYYGLRDYGTGHWEGGDPNCKHYRTSKYSESDCTGHKTMGDCGEAVGDAIYKSICPLCGAVRVDKQIGLEETPYEYINRLVSVFHEVKRVLKDDGTLWVNIGDSYATNAPNNRNFIDKDGRGGNSASICKTKTVSDSIKQKDLIGIPWMLAFALREDGWYLRQDIIWSKLNPMPESVHDRCTKSHEYIFLLSKSPTYKFNEEAVIEEASGYDGRKDTLHKGSPKYDGEEICPGMNQQSLASGEHERWKFKKVETNQKFGGNKYSEGLDYAIYSGKKWKQKYVEVDGEEYVPIRKKRDVWSVAVNNYKGAHFATYSEELITPCILAGSDECDTVIDPFNGSGTTGIASVRNGRKYIGIELNQKYADLSYERFDETFNRKEQIEENKIVCDGLEKVDLLGEE